jgi:hypothetical protein
MTLYAISSDLALAEVNKCLRAQGRAELKVSRKVLMEQLRRDGVLLDEDGRPFSPDDSNSTTQVRIDKKARRAFITSKSLLLGEARRPTTAGMGVTAGVCRDVP